jgi:CheY-like chemotaxis protein
MEAGSGVGQLRSKEGRSLGGGESVLLVEDEEMLRNLAQTILEKQGYSVCTATDGEDALEKHSRFPGEFDLVVTDVVMPRMGGVELCHTLRERGCTSRFLLASGYPETFHEVGGHTPDPDLPLIKKPWKTLQFLETVRQTLDGQPK